MSSKPLIDYFNKIECFNKNYPAFTNSVKVYEDNEDTFAILATDSLVFYVLKYSPNVTEITMTPETFKLNNDDEIVICQGETDNLNSFCETVASFMVESSGRYHPICNEKGFQQLVKTRKAILSRESTYYSYGFTKFTNTQKDEKEAAKMEQADVALVCVDVSRTNPIPGSISTMLNVIFDSVSTMYRKPFFLPKNNSSYNKFKAAMFEWLEFDVPNHTMYGLYEIIKSVLEHGYIAYDEPAF